MRAGISVSPGLQPPDPPDMWHVPSGSCRRWRDNGHRLSFPKPAARGAGGGLPSELCSLCALPEAPAPLRGHGHASPPLLLSRNHTVAALDGVCVAMDGGPGWSPDALLPCGCFPSLSQSSLSSRLLWSTRCFLPTPFQPTAGPLRHRPHLSAKQAQASPAPERHLGASGQFQKF